MSDEEDHEQQEEVVFNEEFRSLRDYINDVLCEYDGWAEIGDIRDMLDELGDGVWNGHIENAIVKAKNAAIRREIKRLRVDDGYRKVQSIKLTNVDTCEVYRVYKQEDLFVESDYEQAVVYHLDRSKYHKVEAEGLDARCVERYDISFLPPQLTFSETADG